MKKLKVNSTAEQSRIMQAANKPIVPPECVPLDAGDMPFFDAVIKEFARAEWTEHCLQLAAQLARMMADLTDEQIALREEGVIAHSEKGTPVINPRKTAVQMYSSTILSIRRSLSLHARAQKGEARDVTKRSKLQKQTEGDAADDDLIGGMGNDG